MIHKFKIFLYWDSKYGKRLVKPDSLLIQQIFERMSNKQIYLANSCSEMMFFCIKLKVFTKKYCPCWVFGKSHRQILRKDVFDLTRNSSNKIRRFQVFYMQNYEISPNQTNITIKIATMYFIVIVQDRHWKSKEKTKANMSRVFSQHTPETV